MPHFNITCVTYFLNLRKDKEFFPDSAKHDYSRMCFVRSRSVRPGSVIAGISVDESVERLTAANATLRHLGINVEGIGSLRTGNWYRSVVFFVLDVATS